MMGAVISKVCHIHEQERSDAPIYENSASFNTKYKPGKRNTQDSALVIIHGGKVKYTNNNLGVTKGAVLITPKV